MTNINFKDETIKAIKDRKIDSFKLFFDTTGYKENIEVYSGKDGIDWEVLTSIITAHCEKHETRYYAYGDSPFDVNVRSHFFGGWITFKDTSDFIEIRANGDNVDYWHQVVRPSL